MIKIEQIRLRKKAGEMHMRADAQLRGQLFKRRLERPFPGDEELRPRMRRMENGKGAQTGR